VSPRQAGEALSRYRQQRAEEAKALEQALGIEGSAAAVSDAAGTGEQAQPAKRDADSIQRAFDDYQQSEFSRTERIATLTSEMARVAAWHETVTSEFQRAFPDVTDEASLHALAVSDPQRYAAAVQVINQARSAANAYHQYQAHAEKERGATFSSWGQLQDITFSQKHPELNDPKTKTAVSDATFKVLSDLGLNRDDLSNLWNGTASLSIRDHRVQEVLLKAARYDMAVSSAKKARPALPPVQRPGTRSVRDTLVPHDVERANDALNKSGRVRDAAALLIAQRRARRG
jgi:hypothetical protein